MQWRPGTRPPQGDPIPMSVAAYGIGCTLRHVTPGGLLQGYRAVTVRERELNRRPTAGGRINTGVYVFTCVNARGIKQLKEKWACARLPRGNPRLLRRQRDENKGSRLKWGVPAR